LYRVNGVLGNSRKLLTSIVKLLNASLPFHVIFLIGCVQSVSDDDVLKSFDVLWCAFLADVLSYY